MLTYMREGEWNRTNLNLWNEGKVKPSEGDTFENHSFVYGRGVETTSR